MTAGFMDNSLRLPSTSTPLVGAQDVPVKRRLSLNSKLPSSSFDLLSDYDTIDTTGSGSNSGVDGSIAGTTVDSLSIGTDCGSTADSNLSCWGCFSENASTMLNNTRNGDAETSGGKSSTGGIDCRLRDSATYHNLSFEEAKKVWFKEFTMNMKLKDDEYNVSTFGDDLDKSMRSTGGNSITADDDVQGDEKDGDIDGSLRKSVRFVDVTIQEYPIIPGTHPGGCSGVPLTISWEHFEPISIDFNAYEEYREPHRRCTAQMRIPNTQRTTMLRNLGFSTKELQESTKAANIGRRQRIRSNDVKLDKTMEQLEFATRKMKHVLTFGKKKRRERAFLSQHVPSYYNERRRKSSGDSVGFGIRRGSSFSQMTC